MANFFFPQCDVIKNVWIYVFTSPYVFKARCLIKRENIFEFILLLNHGQAITPPEEATSHSLQREYCKLHETVILLLPSLRAVIRVNNQVT
jgi:hypothetical protein